MSIVFTANTVRPCKELCGTPKLMPTKRSADATQCFQPFQPGTELVEKVDQPNQPKTVFPKRTRKNPTNPTNQKWLVPIEHDHSILSLKQVILLNVLNFLLLIFSVVLQISLGADVMPMLMSV